MALIINTKHGKGILTDGNSPGYYDVKGEYHATALEQIAKERKLQREQESKRIF